MSSGLKGELLTGVFPVLQLPFDDEDRLDMDAPAAEVEFCVRAGDRAGARKTFNRLLPLINQSVLLETPLVKEVLVRRGVIPSARMRHPGAHQLDASDRVELDAILENLERSFAPDARRGVRDNMPPPGRSETSA